MGRAAASKTSNRIPGMVQHGVVVKFDPERGFGFIRPEGNTNGHDVFVHVHNVAGQRPLRPGQRVTYHVTRSEKGLTALDVQPGTILGIPYLRFFLAGIGGAVLLLSMLTVVRLPATMSLWLSLWIVSLSTATFGLYRYDKFRAEVGGTRVPEIVLHLLSGLGGSPGAFVGMRWPSRHKTAKQRFQAIFWLIVAAQAGLLLFWFWSR